MPGVYGGDDRSNSQGNRGEKTRSSLGSGTFYLWWFFDYSQVQGRFDGIYFWPRISSTVSALSFSGPTTD
jgi:hypothetical protein